MLQNQGKNLKDIIALATLGDEDAQGFICTEFYSHVSRAAYCSLLSRYKHLRDDIVQLTFTRCLKRLHAFEYRDEKQFVGWLCKIALCICRDVMRKERAKEDKLTKSGYDELVAEHIANVIELADDQKGEVNPTLSIVGEILESLDYDCRILLVARLAYGISPAELARETQDLLVRKDKMASPLGEFFAKLFDPMAKEMRDRRDFCFKNFKKSLREKLDGDVEEEGEIETKQASRNRKKASERLHG